MANSNTGVQLPWLPHTNVGGSRLWGEALGDGDGPVLNWQNHFHKVEQAFYHEKRGPFLLSFRCCSNYKRPFHSMMMHFHHQIYPGEGLPWYANWPGANHRHIPCCRLCRWGTTLWPLQLLCFDILTLVQRRMDTSLATYWQSTQRNLTHIFKTMGEPFSLGENHLYQH